MVLEDLLNASIIFIFLVTLGFIISDIFRMGRYFGIPAILKTDTEQLLDYVSTALFFLTFFFILIIMILDAPNSNFITDFVTPFFMAFLLVLSKFSISQDIVFSYMALLFWISLIFMFVYVVVFFIGLFIRSFDENYIEVTFIDSKDTYRSILSETDDFIFFETTRKLFRWEAIRKEKIISMKSIRSKSSVDELVAEFFTLAKEMLNIINSKFRKK